MDKQNLARKDSSRSRISEQPSISQEKVKSLIDSAIKAKSDFKEKCDLILNLIDPSKKEWVPSKVKKQIVDRIKDIIKSSPKVHSAQDKLMALQLLNRAIIKKNQEFNRYVETNLMARLSILAQFNPANNEDSDDPLNITNSSIQNTAQEIMTRGQRIFGPEEKDLNTSAQFLVLLLDLIEKWAKISYEKPIKQDDQKAYTFLQVFTDLHDVKDIVFPSTQIGQKEVVKKQVSFAQQDSDGSCQKSEVQKIDPQTKKSIYSLKRKMLRVKEAAKQCKRYLAKVERQRKPDSQDQLRELFAVSRKISIKCVHFLKPEEFGTYISNSEDLVGKMSKYSEKFQEALDHLNSSECSQKSVSQIVPPLMDLEVLRLSDSKSIEKQPQQLQPSPPVLPKDVSEDLWNSSASSRREDPQNQAPYDDDEFILTSSRTVVIDQGQFDPTKPRCSEQVRIDLDMSYYGDSQFDFEVNEERTTNSMITPDDSDIYYNDFDANIEKQENSELRKPRQKVEENTLLVKQLQDEIIELKSEIQRIKDQNFEESDIAMDMTMAISNANIELQKTKQDHKKEIILMKKVHDELKIQIENFQQELKTQAELVDQKTAQILTFEEYHDAYKRKITHLQAKLAEKYYDPDKEEADLVLSPKDCSKKESFFSPLNFSNLLLVGSEAEKADSLEKPKNSEKPKDSVKTDVSDSVLHSVSGKEKKGDPFGAKVIRSPQDKYDSDENSVDSDDAPRSVTETHLQRDSQPFTKFNVEDSSADKLRTQKQTTFMQKLNKMKSQIQQPPATIVRKSNEELGLNKK